MVEKKKRGRPKKIVEQTESKQGLDVVYLLGTGSIWDNNEIKYSLRSLQKYAKGIRNIYIIGEKPDFLDYSQVKHFPFEETSKRGNQNIAEKVYFASTIEELSDNFIFINDDHFLLKPTQLDEIPYYAKNKTLRESVHPEQRFHWYPRILINTDKVLSSQGYSTYHFDVHTPIVYNKQKFQEVYLHFKSEIETGAGMVVKSMYSNYFGIQPIPYNDCKINKEVSYSRLTPYLEDKFVFSIGDEILRNGEFKQWMVDNYPNKSKFEL
jgi:hypothetical protein